jgi:hypothetical protein
LFPKPVLVGIVNILLFQAQIPGIVFKFNLMGFSEMPISGSMVFVGNNMSGYIGASYDVTDFIRFDRDNVLVVS